MKRTLPLKEIKDPYVRNALELIWAELGENDSSQASEETSSSSGGLPIGAIIDYGGGEVEPDYLLCDGSEYSRVDYAELFQKIGTRHGAGNGSTTFNVPDIRSRVTVGAGQGSGLTNRTVGQSFGEEYHGLTEAEMPAHNHSYAMAGSSIAGNSTPRPANTYVNDNFSPNAPTGNTGGGAGHNNMQPSYVVLKMIKYR